MTFSIKRVPVVVGGVCCFGKRLLNMFYHKDCCGDDKKGLLYGSIPFLMRLRSFLYYKNIKEESRHRHNHEETTINLNI